MAANDHLPYTENGAGPRRVAFDVNATATFERGEPVRMNAAGEVVEGTSPIIIDTGIYGISADSSLDGAGVNINAAGGQGFTNGQVTVYPADGLFKTARFSTGGAGVAATPTQAHVGDAAGFVLTGGVWFLDIGTATTIARIVAVLDENGQKVEISGGTGVWVVYQIVNSQMTAGTEIVDALA